MLLWSSWKWKFQDTALESVKDKHWPEYDQIPNQNSQSCFVILFVICVANNSSPKKYLLNTTGLSTFEEDIPCSLCDKTFRTKKHLANHKFSKHTEKESLQCDVKSDDTECSYHTTSVSNLNAHKKRMHEKTVNAVQQLVFKFACSSCDFKTGKNV